MSDNRLRFRDLFLFQVGHAGAIRRVIASRWSLVIGALLVFTAGIARNYDQTYLLLHGERLGGPYIAAIISALLVFIAIYFSGTRKGKDHEDQTGFSHQFPGFFGGFLMTAPLAWIYAIPVETWTDSLLAAAKWNVAFLSLVSLWRIWLITRVAQVITGASFVRLLFAILIPASAEAFVGTFFAGFDLAGAMGGILPPDKQFTVDALDVIFTGAGITFLVSVAACLVIGSIGWKKGEGWRGNFVGTWSDPPKALLVYVAIIALFWLVGSIPSQARLGNRERISSLIRKENYDEAIAFLRSREIAAFPTRRPLYFNPRYLRHDSIARMIERIEPDDPDWIAAEYLRTSQIALSQRLGTRRGYYSEESRALVQAVLTLPGGSDMLQETVETLADRHSDIDYFLPPEQLELFFSDLEKADIEIPSVWTQETKSEP